MKLIFFHGQTFISWSNFHLSAKPLYLLVKSLLLDQINNFPWLNFYFTPKPLYFWTIPLPLDKTNIFS
jgi:hypothetical protein